MRNQIISIMPLCFTLCISSTYGKYSEPTSKTNINKVDPLFEENIQDYRSLEQTIGNQSKSGVEGIKGKKGMSDLVGSSEANSKANELSNINSHDIGNKGTEEKSNNAWIDEYLIDYSKPGNKRHQEDAKDITKATGKMMDNILGTLKDIGVDCKSAKGSSKIEPQYFIELNKDQIKNTNYDKVLCQELRNKYNCFDKLEMKCKQISPVWKTEEIFFWWRDIIGSTEFWRDKNSKMENVVRLIELSKSNGNLKLSIAQRTGKNTEDIGNIDCSIISNRIYTSAMYSCEYSYKDGSEKCIKWQESWTETCRLQ